MAVEEIVSIRTIQLVWHFLVRYYTKSCENHQTFPSTHIVPSASVRRWGAHFPGSFSCLVDCRSAQALPSLGNLPDHLCLPSPLPPLPPLVWISLSLPVFPYLVCIFFFYRFIIILHEHIRVPVWTYTHWVSFSHCGSCTSLQPSLHFHDICSVSAFLVIL